MLNEQKFTHTKKGETVWVLGVINNQNKNKFILEAILKRDSNTINKYIGKGDTIMTVGWILYVSWSCEFRLISWYP